jgi:hypothetical protein
MTPSDFFHLIIAPGSEAVPMMMNTIPSQVLLMAIAGQESAWQYRIQIPSGEARSFWQLEQQGAIADVMADPNTAMVVSTFCDTYSISPDTATLFDAVAYNDTLAYLIARLALWQDSEPLPKVGDEESAWNYYNAVWRPGDPHPDSWPAIYTQAMAFFA